MNASRRAMLAVSALAIPAALLAGCAMDGTTPLLTPAQVIDDANNVVQALGSMVTQIAVAQPSLIPDAVVTQIKEYTADAASVLASLSTSTAANSAATALQQVVADVEAVLTAISALPGLPVQVTTVTSAASVVLPIIMAFITSTLGIIMPAKAAPASGMTVAQARAILSASH